MILKRIETNRFILRELCKKDASTTYLNWLKNSDSSKYILTANQTRELEDLETYIDEKLNDQACLFLGVFTKDNETHIGNIKYEPIDLENREVAMGILIGDSNWRGKGVAKEIIVATCEYLKNNYTLKRVILGVENNNIPALRAYQKIGFKKFSDSGPDAVLMELIL